MVYLINQWLQSRDEAIIVQKFTLYAMLECFKVCPIMLLVCPYYAHAASDQIIENCTPKDAYTNKISTADPSLRV